MPVYWLERRRRALAVQGSGRAWQVWPWLGLPACVLLAACSDPLAGPIDLFHDLEGGQIAAHRPPPPGLGEPYPKLGTVPAKPVVADAGYRQALQSQLSTERDRTERVAADRPIEAVPPPPPPQPAAIPAASAPPPAGPDGAPQPPASASLDTAEAPPPAPSPAPARVAVAQPSAGVAAPAEAGPPAGAPLTIAGAPPEFAALPDMPEVPPSPATFEGVAGVPAPTPARLPARLPPLPTGTPIFFPVASAALPASQIQPLRDFLGHRRGQAVEILGLGDAAADTPEGQATAIALGLARAQAVAAELAILHVPAASLRLGADAFGRGAVLRLLP